MNVTENTITKTQQKQLDFLERLEPYESIGKLSKFLADCRTCKLGKEFSSCDGTRAFINNHRGHKTWIKYLGKVNP